MTGVPPEIPCVIPVEPMVASVISLLLHMPPVVASVSVVVAPRQIFPTPLIPTGDGLTVIGIVTVQPTPLE